MRLHRLCLRLCAPADSVCARLCAPLFCAYASACACVLCVCARVPVCSVRLPLRALVFSVCAPVCASCFGLVLFCGSRSVTFRVTLLLRAPASSLAPVPEPVQRGTKFAQLRGSLGRLPAVSAAGNGAGTARLVRRLGWCTWFFAWFLVLGTKRAWGVGVGTSGSGPRVDGTPGPSWSPMAPLFKSLQQR